MSDMEGTAPVLDPRPGGYIAAVGTLEAISYLSSSALAEELPWVALSIFLIRKIWRGSHGAWSVLVALNAVVAVVTVLAIFRVIPTNQGASWLLWEVFLMVLELLVLLSPRIRQWVD